jgi:hypothetical protein
MAFSYKDKSGHIRTLGVVREPQSQSRDATVVDLRDGSRYHVSRDTAGEFVRQDGSFVIVSCSSGSRVVRIPIEHARIEETS